MATAEHRQRVDAITEENWATCQRLRRHGTWHLPVHIEERDGRYRGVFGIDGKFGYDRWFVDLATALLWANEDSHGPVVRFARPGQTLPYPPPTLKGWEGETLRAKIGWCLLFALLAIAFVFYAALFVFSIWIFPHFPPLLIALVLAAAIGYWDGNTLAGNSPYALERRRRANAEGPSETGDRR